MVAPERTTDLRFSLMTLPDRMVPTMLASGLMMVVTSDLKAPLLELKVYTVRPAASVMDPFKMLFGKVNTKKLFGMLISAWVDLDSGLVMKGIYISLSNRQGISIPHRRDV